MVEESSSQKLNVTMGGDVEPAGGSDNSTASDVTDSDLTDDNDDEDPPSKTCSMEDASSKTFSMEETLLIFDWDDTMLPSTWIQEQGLRLDDASVVAEEQRQIFDLAAQTASNLLALAKTFGTVVLVTNAEQGWIELSCQKFLPQLYPQLDGVRMVSARSSYEPQGITSPFEWKYQAFNWEVHRYYFSSGPNCRRNMISFGDSAHERQALIRVAQDLPSCCVKSLKFMERPNVEQLKRQHELVTGYFQDVVNHDGNLDLCIRCT